MFNRSRSTDKLALLTKAAKAMVTKDPTIVDKLKSVELDWKMLGGSMQEVALPTVKITFK